MVKKHLENDKKTDRCQQNSSDKVNKNDVLEAALAYKKLGFSIIPLKEKGKTPLIKSWRPFQKKPASEEQIHKWWNAHPRANIGIICGKVSGLVVLDADSKKARSFIKKNGFKRTPVSATAKGRHIYFKHPGERVRNKVGSELGLDIRADGGYVVAPPSIHPNGKEYKWLLSPWNQCLADLPSWVKELSNDKSTAKLKEHNNRKGWVELALSGVKKG